MTSKYDNKTYESIEESGHCKEARQLVTHDKLVHAMIFYNLVSVN